MGPHERPAPLFQLGGLDVLAPLGEGAMAEVWSARHAATGTMLALKILKFGQDKPELAHALGREVRAMARLTHQNIVGVVGHGTVTAVDAAQAPQRLVAGAPWFAMEQLEGSLRERMPQDWSSIRAACRQILLGLAHAHARGVIHRDLKPSNVLLAGSDGGVRFAIADFGIAHVRDERDMKSAQLRRVMGTPLYMAPEQYAGRWRDFGPWTDLYALGCMVFELVYGRPPFIGAKLIDLAREHMESPVPNLVARVAIPDGVAEWLMCLMAKAPGQRPSCAADALASLPDGADGFHIAPSDAPDWGLAATMQLLDPLDFATTALHGDSLSSAVTEAETILHIAPAPIPLCPPAAHKPTPDTGELATSLFELRPLPSVGRDADRVDLWADLHRVVAGGAFARILEGPETAVGDLVMGQFAQSAVEAGAAIWLECAARNGGDRVLLNGLTEMLGTMGLSSAEIEQSLTFSPRSASWTADHRSRLAEVLSTASTAAQPRMGTHAARERHATVRETLRVLAADRPLVVTLVDAHVDDLEAIEGLLDDEAREPLLFVGWVSETTRNRMQGWAAEAFTKLRAHPRSEVMELEALSPTECVQLIARNLHLSPEAFEAAERAELGPSATVQLFGHWIRTGLLEWSRDGFQLADAASLPSGTDELWHWRLRELEPHLEALEIAAVLGRVVSLSDWHAVCAAAGIEAAREALDTTAERGMGTVTTDQFTFASEDLRLAVLERAPAARRRLVHGLVADTLELPLQRHLHHLLESERNEELLETLGGIWVPGFIAETSAPAVVQMGEEAARRLGLDSEDLRVARVDRHRARRLRMDGRLDEAIRINDQVLRVAQREGDWRLEADSLVRSGVYLQLRGKLKPAGARMREALRRLKPHGYEEPRMVGMTMLALGMLEGDMGDLSGAIGHVRAACRILDGSAEGDALASAQVGLGSLLVRAERFEEARVALARAIEICETVGSRLVLGRTLNMLGDLEHSVGNLPEAQSHYQRARRALAFVGGDDVAYPLFNLAMLAFLRGENADAVAFFREVKTIADRYGAARLRAFATTGLRAIDARLGGMRQAAEWDEVASFIEQGNAGAEVSQLLEAAGSALSEAGAMDAARRVRELALASWRHMGREREAEALAKVLDS